MATAAPSPTTAAAQAGKPAAHPRDSVREVFETIVFVVVLVLMLKLFVVEAFVIPTGSMAETLLGYNKVVRCEECQFEFPVNATSEGDPQDGRRVPVVAATCPNCRAVNRWKPGASPGVRSGDRVLVHKALYHARGGPDRGDVVVFKYPVDPQVGQTAQNYIKRLWGKGGETIAIRDGDLYRTTALKYDPDDRDPFGRPLYPRPDDPLKLWEGPESRDNSKTVPRFTPEGPDFTYHNAEAALKLFEASRRAGFPSADTGFELLRKSDDQAHSMRRIVYDNDHQADSLAKRGVPPRWSADGAGWTADNRLTPKTFAHAGSAPGWLRYRHRVSSLPTEEERRELRPDAPPVDWLKLLAGVDREGLFPPSPITNFLGYNAGVEQGAFPRSNGDYWVGDLMLECTAKFSGPGDELTLELSKGVNRFRATFAGGNVTLSRVGPGGRDLATRPTGITGGTHALRFTNFDCRLRVHVDGKAVDFGADADYAPGDAAGFEAAVGGLAGGALAPRPDGHTLDNDVLAPAGVGAAGGVEVGKLVLWEDTFFTPFASGGPADVTDTFYAQPGHYLCFGDNSGQSSDSRRWGSVPERLVLGKAVFVFAPFFGDSWLSLRLDRVGFIR